MSTHVGSSKTFRTTRWSVIVSARGKDPTAVAALESLCKAYWFPLYAYVRRRGHSIDGASDLTQAFFHSLLERDAIARADQHRGRFRHFLLRSLSNFLSNERARNNALRRGGGKLIVSIDAHSADAQYISEPAHDLTPERLFHRRWALSILQRTMSELRDRYRQHDAERVFEVLKQYLSCAGGEQGYRDVAAQLASNEAAVKTAVYRLRRRYREVLREIVRSTVETEEEVEQEIIELFQALSR